MNVIDDGEDELVDDVGAELSDNIDMFDEDYNMEHMLRDAEVNFTKRQFDKLCHIKEDQKTQLYPGCEK